ncbi:MAG: formylglycine-generating enzyme family protein, partial [Thermoguttaceae bacterium]
MRTFVTWSVTVLAMAGTAFSEEPQQPPKELTVDLGKGVKLDMVLIPAGEFKMGSGESAEDTVAFFNKTYGEGFLKADFFKAEHPQHRVRITKPFYLGKYLVTQEQWEAVMGSNPSEFKGPNNPVEKVSWEDCQQFLGKLNAKSAAGGGKFQLPSEAQWEYACRAGSKTKYCFGDDKSKLGEYAWYDANSGNTTHPVGGKKPNAWGLYDMHGNVCEWCQDWWGRDYYAKSPADDPTGAATGSDRVFRGGGWGGPAWGCRSALRIHGEPGLRAYLGLRVSRVP